MGDAPPFGLTRPPATSTDSSADAPHPTIIPSTAHLPCTKTHTASTACAPLHRVVHSSSVRLQHTSPTDVGTASTLSCASFAYSHALPHFRPACHLPARETTARMPPPSILLPLRSTPKLLSHSPPQPAWRRPDGSWQPSLAHFTSLADPSAVGSGLTALTTLMHEAGHAAHFANIDQPSPLFSQERAPTSVAYAENQAKKTKKEN